MSGMVRFWFTGFRALRSWMKQGRPRVSRRGFARALAFAAILCIALIVANRRAAAQEHDEAGMSETSLRKRQPAQQKKADVVPPPAGMTFTTRLDHTAVWVGDQFRYMIQVDYTPDYEFVLDNLTKETINMDPFQVMDVAKNVTTMKNNNKRLDVVLTLANFGTGQASLQVPQFTLYYFRKDRKTSTADQAAAESLTISGTVIGLRSTLPPQAQDIRDFISVSSWARSRWALPVAGAICAVILLGGVGWEVAMLVRRRKTRKGPDRRKAMEAVRSRWASSVPSEFSDSRTAAEFFNSSYQNVKEYVGYYLETPTLGLTAEELQDEMQRLGANPDFTRRVVKVLSACESVRYQPNALNGNSAESARNVAQDVREILNTRP
ncbi:MAG: hypothetical protein HYX72_01935 [Acidobacteria bacterium]|nr:hypothetical protein [Acidobacteriota bacterium]